MGPSVSLGCGIALLALIWLQERRGKTISIKYYGKVIVSRRKEPDQYWYSILTQLAVVCILFGNALIKLF